MCARISAEVARRTGEPPAPPEEYWRYLTRSGECFPVAEMFWNLFPNEAPAEWKALVALDAQAR